LAGIGLIILGTFLEFPLPGWELLAPQSVQSARETVLSVALVTSAFFGIVVYKVAQARMMKVKVGPEQLIGKTGTVTTSLTPRGEVRVEGQIWRAETIGGEAKQGAQVVVINREGLILKVKPTQPQS